MAEESEDGAEKTEEPTARKLDKAREDGQVPRSAELPAAAVMIGGMVVLALAGHWMLQELSEVFVASMIIDRGLIFSDQLLPALWTHQLGSAFMMLLPLLMVTAVLAILATTLMSGLLFSVKALVPKASKLNPINGFKRMFGLNALVELVKTIGKFTLVSLSAAIMVGVYWDELLRLGLMSLQPAMARMGSILTLSGLVVTVSLVLIAALDVPYQRHAFVKRMRMTRQEVRDELKDMEGRPEVRAQIRKRQRELASSRMMARVKDADLVLTNPEHFAVALAYGPESEGAPVVIAKGIDELALRIRSEAAHHGIHEFREPTLARAVYFTTKLEQEIPEGLYLPVAQVLAYVFSLDAASAQGRATRPRPQVPEDMRFDANGDPMGRAV